MTYQPKKGDVVRALVDSDKFDDLIDRTSPHHVVGKCEGGDVLIVLDGRVSYQGRACWRVCATNIEPWVDAETAPEPQPAPTVGAYEALGTQIGALVDNKQRQYGNSFGKCGEFLRLLYPDGVAPDAYGDVLTLVRIFDKLMRVANGGHGDGESPWRDIAGYALLGEMAHAQKGGDAS